LQSISSQARNNILLLRNAAEDSQASATTTQYRRFNTASWAKWTSFIGSIDIGDDPFLEKFEQHERNQFITLFAQYLRSKPTSTGRVPELAEGSIRNTISTVAQTFLENHAADPRIANDGNTAISIRRILAGFKALDSNDKRQKAIPISVIRQVHKLYSKSNDPQAIAVSQLIVGAFFFAMRSCEYSKTTSPTESKRTKIVSIGDVRFFRHSQLIQHKDDTLQDVDIVSITFRSQKNGEKNQTISMHKSNDPDLCPVKIWASIIKRIRSYKSASDSSPVNCCISNQGTITQITSNQIRNKVRAAAASIGEDALGFKLEEIGCHSLRSGSAMAMYLAGIPITTIQLIGRWKSDAFMRYIREQVDCFTENVSAKMIAVKNFYTIPDTTLPDCSLKNSASTQHGPNLSIVFNALVL